MAPTSPGNCSSSLRIARAALRSQADSGTSSSLAAEPGERTGAAGLICWAPDGLNWALCSLRNRCTNSLSWADEMSGSQACVGASFRTPSRDAWTFVWSRRRRRGGAASRRRRHGDHVMRGASYSLETVRTASNSKKKPATTSSPGDDARRRREGAAAPRDAANLRMGILCDRHII